MTVAYDTAGLLHRDISMGNILIDSHGRGLLSDWDHAGEANVHAGRIVSVFVDVYDQGCLRPIIGDVAVHVHSFPRRPKQDP